MIAPDDINVGDFLTVLRGQMVPSMLTPFGEVSRELHFDLKGVPLAVVAVQIPYLLVAILPCGSTRILDVRESEFMRCQESYVRDFQAHMQHAAELARVANQKQ